MNYNAPKENRFKNVFFVILLSVLSIIILVSCGEAEETVATTSDLSAEILNSVILKDIVKIKTDEITPEDFITAPLSSELSLDFGNDNIFVIGENDVHFILTYQDKTKELSAKLTLVEFNNKVSLPVGSDKVITVNDFLPTDELSGEFVDFDPNALDRSKMGEHQGKIRIGDDEYDIILSFTDNEPPIFSGLTDKSIMTGGSISYKKGVTVSDNSGEEITFSVNSSDVDKNKPGTYTVIYSATDGAGNTAEEKITVTVKEKSYDEARRLIEEKAATFIKDGMSNDEKIKAVWNYTKKHVRYTGSSVKGEIFAAAYDGIATGGGDCYTYYAVNDMFFEYLGIERVEVRRINGTSNHWWHLVKFDDGYWYFVDSCKPPKTVIDYYDELWKLTKTRAAELTAIVEEASPGRNYYVYDEATLAGYKIAE